MIKPSQAFKGKVKRIHLHIVMELFCEEIGNMKLSSFQPQEFDRITLSPNDKQQTL